MHHPAATFRPPPTFVRSDPAPASTSSASAASPPGATTTSRAVGPTLTASDPAVALLAVAQRALDVPVVRLAAAATGPVPDGDSRAWFPTDDPIGAAIVAEVHAIGGPLAIEDTRAAAPFRGTVVFDGMRAMACLAAPVRDRTGATIAALCALDGVPRWWTDRDTATLGAIATALGALLPEPHGVPSAAPTATRATDLGNAEGRRPEPRDVAPRDVAPREMPSRDAALHETPPREMAPRDETPHDATAIGSLAQLTGGIAHHFNNQLTVVSANAELLRDTLAQLAGPESVRQSAVDEVDAIARAARQASELTWQLLAFGRVLPLAPERLDLHERLTALEARLRRDAGTGIALELTLAAPRPHVQMDPSHFDHVLLALVDNARRAMPDGGRLGIRTERITLDATRRGAPDDVPLGTWVVLSVIDAGVGIPDAIVPRLFEPFYSTREIGSGAGLGLAAVHGIMAQSDGYCTVDSTEGVGTVVRLWIPEPAR
ncbi:MAG TPA: ATP-binding protein [Gemmatimonadaceae bacterium]|nr:ATP-binding protein [Gemmatimonadaceae bacterium]